MADNYPGYTGPTFDETNADQLIRTWPGNGSPGSRGPDAATPPEPGPPPPAENPSLAGDPAYLAFQRALGLTRDTARRNTQAQVDTINQQLPGQLDWLSHTNDLANTQIQGSMEARGIRRSGETEQNLANQGASYGRATADLNDSAANRIAAMQQALAQQEAGWAGQDITEQQSSADRQQAAKAQADLQQQMIDAERSNNSALVDALHNGTMFPDLSSLLPGGVSGITSASAPASLAAFHLSPSESFVVSKESGGSTTARNPSSGAFGIGQLNPSSGTLQSISKELGVDPYTTDPATQVAMMRRYIADRYGSADAAAAHERQFGWY